LGSEWYLYCMQWRRRHEQDLLVDAATRELQGDLHITLHRLGVDRSALGHGWLPLDPLGHASRRQKAFGHFLHQLRTVA
ncbi:unnamed protein product, partial [Polarella glacialis]